MSFTAASASAGPVVTLIPNSWDAIDMPPMDDIINAVHMFTTEYFQLGFIAKTQFINTLKNKNEYRKISPFLLLAILGISGRFVRTIVDRFGSKREASEHFIKLAATVSLGELHRVPALERCQAFYLLAIAQHGQSMKWNSNVGLPVHPPGPTSERETDAVV